jgi:hypothetical protein
MDPTKSGSALVLVAGTIASVAQPIVASVGGTIALPSGDSATIPPGVLKADTMVTLQLNSVPTQPTNTLFGGIGTSMLMSFSPALGTAAVKRLAKPSVTSSSPAITFVLKGGQDLDATQLQNALGVSDVNDGTDNFFAVPSSFDAVHNQTTIQIDPSTVEASSTLSVGLALSQTMSLNHSGNAWIQEWNNNSLSFSDVQTGFCPTGPRTLVLVHGMFSSPNGSFGQQGLIAKTNGWATFASSNYTTILGIDYYWWEDINTSSTSLANILNSMFDSASSPCNYAGTFDIEAHSEGTIVTLNSTGAGLTTSTESKLRHVVLVAGPIDGTPMAQNPFTLLTFYLNISGNPGLTTMPGVIQDAVPFITQLEPYSDTVRAAQSAAQKSLGATEIMAVGGDHVLGGWVGYWLDTIPIFAGQPNDGVVPVSSALPTDSVVPNLVRLEGNDPTSGDFAYPDDHISLVNNPSVMPDILSALNDGGATSQVGLTMTPTMVTISPEQSISLTASVSGMLNPHIQWTASGGSLSNTTGATVQYTAPQQSGGSFQVTATVPAIELSGNELSITSDITVSSSTNPVPVITQLSPPSASIGANLQALTITGTGFLSSSTVTFNGASRAVTAQSATQLTIALLSADVASVGAYPVIVTNPAPGGGSSAAVNFSVVSGQVLNEWTWMGGSGTVSTIGNYGTLGVSSVSNIPGSRYEASSWTDSGGKLWLFGGQGLDSTGALASLNDLWAFDPSAGTWVWLSGSKTGGASAVYGVEGVPATTNVPGARIYSSSWIDSTNHLWLFGGDGVGSNGIAGFLDDLWEFDPVAKTWTWVSGSSMSGVPGVYGTLGVPSTSNVPGGRYFAISWIDSKNNLWLFGGDGEASTTFYAQLDDLWEFNPPAKTWTWVSGSNALNVDGVYGTKGVPSSANAPGSRSKASVGSTAAEICGSLAGLVGLRRAVVECR